MRILWLNVGILPTACHALGINEGVGGGWLEASLNALCSEDPSSQFCVVGLDSRICDVFVGNARYLSLQGEYTYDVVPPRIEARVGQIVAEFNPDIIHVHGTEFFYGRMNAAVYCGKPVVVSLQGMLTQYWRHYSGGLVPRDYHMLSLTNLRVLLKGRSVYKEQRIWERERARQEREVLMAQKYFIGRTAWDRSCLETYNRGANYFHVNETMRKPFYETFRSDEAICRHSIYCAGAAAYPLKGAHWLLHAVSILKEEFPDVQLRIAGAADFLSPPRSFRRLAHDQVYHAYLRNLVKKLGVDKHVVALPALSAEQVANELRTAALYVSASLCENSPNSLGEAMLVGTPAIHTFVGGVPSLLKDGEEGRLVPSCDPHALAGAIREWFLYPEKAKDCAKRARVTALQRHDPVLNARRTFEVYREIIAREKGNA